MLIDGYSKCEENVIIDFQDMGDGLTGKDAATSVDLNGMHFG